MACSDCLDRPFLGFTYFPWRHDSGAILALLMTSPSSHSSGGGVPTSSGALCLGSVSAASRDSLDLLQAVMGGVASCPRANMRQAAFTAARAMLRVFEVRHV
jgi:hypothetical protein